MTMQVPAIFLMGPTASGKTDLALKLLEEGFNGKPLEIISVDSALVYKGMDIGTAKPDKETLKRAPHRLIDCCQPTEAYSAASFRQDALREMRDIASHGAVPLLVGGTMLYFRALEYGLSELPEADPEVRKKLEHQAKQHGWNWMHARLQQVDPASAARIHPNDPQRIQRALEVYEITGESMSDLHKNRRDEPIPYRIIKLALTPADRAVLHERIAQRFDQMLEQGFVEEVNHFYQRDDMNIELPAMRAVGYRQVWEYLDGQIDETQMRERAIAATRQFAKRQLTWLRNDSSIRWFDPTDKNLLSNVLNFLDSVTI